MDAVLFNEVIQNLLIDDNESLLSQNFETTKTIFFVDQFPERLPKVSDYAEKTVPEYDTDDFKYHYRLSKESFYFLLEKLRDRLTATTVGGDAQVPPEKMLLIFVWYMATQESMREIAHLFGISISTTHKIIIQLLDVMEENSNLFIQWPTLEEQERSSRNVQNEFRIEGVIGYIDGTHIRLNHRFKEDQDYINRKRYPSIQLQIVVDPFMKIINANAGWPGCVNDARVLSNSALYNKAEMGELFGHGKILIGDSAYPLRRWLVSVMKDNGRLTLPQRQFNRCLSSMRQLVERVIGHVKGRFRRLRCVHVYKVETATKIVIAACVLHNVCIANQEELEYLEFNDEQGHIQNFGIPNNNDGIAIRDRLVRVFEN